ncbi:MAG: DUF4364 family protein [Ruminococcus sp.]|nr:DUF4364 family protein [Ruminococcus sp.]
MAFDTFDEGISLGGVRSKTEIRTLICYIFDRVSVPMKKETIVTALQQKGLANYFECSSSFDDLCKSKNLELVDEEKKLYFITDSGKLIARQLEDTLAYTVKEKACECTLSLLEKERIEKENVVTITKVDNGYNVTCSISGGDMDLLKFTLYVPDINQARIVRKNFHKNPQQFYNTIIAMLTRNKGAVTEALKDLNSIL